MRLSKKAKEEIKDNYDEAFKLYKELKEEHKKVKFHLEVLEHQNQLDKDSEEIKKIIEGVGKTKKDLRSIKRYLDIAKKENEANE